MQSISPYMSEKKRLLNSHTTIGLIIHCKHQHVQDVNQTQTAFNYNKTQNIFLDYFLPYELHKIGGSD